MLEVNSALVMSYTALPIFMDDASAAEKLPCPFPVIMVAIYVYPTGVNIDMLVLLFNLNHIL